MTAHLYHKRSLFASYHEGFAFPEHVPVWKWGYRESGQESQIPAEVPDVHLLILTFRFSFRIEEEQPWRTRILPTTRFPWRALL